MNPTTLYGIGVALVFAGVVLIFVAIALLLFFSVKENVKMKGGGAIIIGPIPIVFGTDKNSVKTILLLSLILTLLLIILLIIPYRL